MQQVDDRLTRMGAQGTEQTPVGSSNFSKDGNAKAVGIVLGGGPQQGGSIRFEPQQKIATALSQQQQHLQHSRNTSCQHSVWKQEQSTVMVI